MHIKTICLQYGIKTNNLSIAEFYKSVLLSHTQGQVVNILAISFNANFLKKENKKIPHQRYRLSVIDFD